MIPIENKDTRPDWATIEAEYVSGDMGVRKLAEKYGIPYPTMRTRSEVGGWLEKRKEHKRKVIEESSQKTADAAASNAAKLEKAKGLALDLALEILRKYPKNAGNKLRTLGKDKHGNDIMTEFELLSIVSSLEKLEKNTQTEGSATNELLESLLQLERQAAGHGD